MDFVRQELEDYGQVGQEDPHYGKAQTWVEQQSLTGAFSPKNAPFVQEMVVPTVLLLSILLAFYVVITLYPDLVPIENSHEERNSKENASNILETIRDLTSDGADARKGMFGKIIW